MEKRTYVDVRRRKESALFARLVFFLIIGLRQAKVVFYGGPSMRNILPLHQDTKPSTPGPGWTSADATAAPKYSSQLLSWHTTLLTWSVAKSFRFRTCSNSCKQLLSPYVYTHDRVITTTTYHTKLAKNRLFLICFRPHFFFFFHVYLWYQLN